MGYHRRRQGSGQVVFEEKFTDEQGCLWEMNIWKVPASDKYLEGIRYRLAFIPCGQNSPAVLYDNHHPKGHHRHVSESEEPYEFRGVNKLIGDFREDVRRVKGDRP